MTFLAISISLFYPVCVEFVRMDGPSPMTKPDGKAPERPVLSARIAGILLLALLPIIALWVAAKGRHYDPALYDAAAESSATEAKRAAARPAVTPLPAQAVSVSEIPSPVPATAAPSPVPASPAQAHLISEALLPPIPAGAIYKLDDTPQFFDSKTIFDKIDGAAPQFLELGFRELMTQSYAPVNPDLFGCEIFVYEMTSPANAKSICEKQDTGQSRKVGIGDGGRRFAAAWSFHQGPYYVIVSNADQGEAPEKFSEQMARGLAEKIAKQIK